MLGYKLSVLPYVRQAMFSRPFHNDDLLPRIRKPVLIMEALMMRSSKQLFSTDRRPVYSMLKFM